MLETLIVNLTNTKESGLGLSEGIACIALLVSIVALLYSVWAAKTANAISLLDIRAQIAMELYDFVMLLEAGSVKKEGEIILCSFRESEIKTIDQVIERRKIAMDFQNKTFKAKYVFNSETVEKISAYYSSIFRYLNQFDEKIRAVSNSKNEHEVSSKNSQTTLIYLICEGKATLKLMDNQAKIEIKSPFDSDFKS